MYSTRSFTASGGLLGRRRRALGLLDQLADGVRRRGPDLQPVRHAHLVVAQLRRIAGRIVDTELLDVAAVARAARVGGDDAVERSLLGSLAREADLDGH